MMEQASKQASKRIDALLIEANAVLIRQGKHLVYRLPNGEKFTRPKTPSCARSELNCYSHLRHVLGLTSPESRVGDRKQPKSVRRIQPRQTYFEPAPVLENFQRKLLKAGYEPPTPVVPSPPERKPREYKPPMDRAKCFSYPPEILQEANRIMRERGTPAMNEFLSQHRDDAMEIQKVKLKPEELPLSIDTHVERARKQLIQLQAEITAAKATVIHNEKLIADHELKMQSLVQFVSAYDLATEEAKKVEELLGKLPVQPTSILATRPARAARGAFGGEMLFSRTHDLLSREGGASTEELFQTVRKTLPEVTKQQVTTTVQYEITRERLRRIGSGMGVRYTLPQQAQAAGAA